MIERPLPGEYSGFEPTYVARVPNGADVLAVLRGQPNELGAMLGAVGEERAEARPRPSDWSLKEVVGHLCDTERIFLYRAVRIARGDRTPLPGFEQDDYVAATNFNARSLRSLLEEFEFQRRANLLCLEALTTEELARAGIVNGKEATARAIVYVAAGHVMHHVESLHTDYAALIFR